jgi:hypothetical protein
MLASFYFPAIPHHATQLHSIEQNALNYGRELCENIFFDNRFKLAGFRCAPYCQSGQEHFNGDSWQAIQNELTLKYKKGIRSKLFIARGADPAPALANTRIINDKHCFGGFTRSALMLENGASSAANLENILERAYSMIGQHAYLYQY